MHIAFICAGNFSRRALERLLAIHAEIVGVCALQDSKFNADHVNLGAISEAHRLPWFYAEDINSTELRERSYP